MEPNQVNEFLATELMGWHTHKLSLNFWTDGRGEVVRKTIWNPLEDIQQAFEVVGKMAENEYKYELYSAGDEHVCIFKKDNDNPMSRKVGIHTNPATAISLAAVAALEGKGEGG